MRENTKLAHATWLTLSSLSGSCLLLLLWGGVSWATIAIMGWSLLVYLALTVIVAERMNLADRISASRAVLAVAALATGYLLDNAILQVGLFALAIATDALDGYVARSIGATDHGAILDMEADQLLVLMLAVAVWDDLALGGFVLLLPALKYVFTLLNLALKLPAGEPKPVEGDNRRAKLVYVLVLLALVTGLPALAMQQLSMVCLLFALPALLASFLADLRHQWGTA